MIDEEHFVSERTLDGSDPLEARVTSPYLTKFEKARVLSARAAQINQGAKVMVEVGTEIDALEIAKKEFAQGRLPVRVRRYLPDGTFEEWALNELTCEVD